MMSAAWQQELQRQQALVQALFQTQPSAEPDPRLQAWEQGAAWQAGLAAYRGNGLEHARAAPQRRHHHGRPAGPQAGEVHADRHPAAPQRLVRDGLFAGH